MQAGWFDVVVDRWLVKAVPQTVGHGWTSSSDRLAGMSVGTPSVAAMSLSPTAAHRTGRRRRAERRGRRCPRPRPGRRQRRDPRRSRPRRPGGRGVGSAQRRGPPGRQRPVGLRPELSQGEGESLVHKQFGDSFEETELEDVLAEAGVGHLVVAGAATDACIRSTIHGAVTRGYDVTLVGDAHTTGDLTSYGAPPPEAVIAHTNLYWSFHEVPGRTTAVLDTADVQFTGDLEHRRQLPSVDPKLSAETWTLSWTPPCDTARRARLARHLDRHFARTPPGSVRSPAGISRQRGDPRPTLGSSRLDRAVGAMR